VIAYRATLDVPRELAWFAAKLLLAERYWRNTARGSRALTCFWQAVLGLRWFRDRITCDALARDHGISRATAYRYVQEFITVLADQAPALSEALEQARNEGFSHVILDGTVIPATGAKSRPSASPARSSTCGIRVRRTPTAATSRPSSPPMGSRCGSPMSSPARRTTLSPPAPTPCPLSTGRPQQACPHWPIPATRARASAS
jgi:hypothetical protein